MSSYMSVGTQGCTGTKEDSWFGISGGQVNYSDKLENSKTEMFLTGGVGLRIFEPPGYGASGRYAK